MFDINKLKKGDILLSYNKDNIISQEIAKATNSSWSHAFLYIGENQIIESTGTGGGVNAANIDKYQMSHYQVAALRIKSEIASLEQIDLMIEYTKKDIGLKYGYFQIVYLWFIYKFNLIKDKFWQREVDSGKVCSELILRAGEKAGIKLFNKNPSIVAPCEFIDNNKLDRIF